MIQFEWPWLFLALPLPWLIRRWLPAMANTQEAALRVPFLEDFSDIRMTGVHAARVGGVLWLAALAWLLLVTASTRPQWQGEAVELPVSGRDLMLAVDLSGSMEVEDFRLHGRTVNRLMATQAIAGDFIERRVGDRVGLILFGRQAYLQTPLTFDRETVHTLLSEAAIGLAGQETAIGDAIGLAVKRLREMDQHADRNQTAGPDAKLNARANAKNSRVLILLTDGANTAGEVEPIKAAELAAAEGLKVYTIGIGADEMMVRLLFGGARRINPSADLDEKTLKAIAASTGGQYFRARDSAELEKIYQVLDELEPVEQETQTFRPVSALYPVPLALALIIAALLAFMRVVAR